MTFHEELLKHPDADEEVLTFWDRHRLSLLLVLTVATTIVLTVVSIIIYEASGAAQLDLSRPGYQSVADQVDENAGIRDYSPFGAVNTETIKEFTDLYDEQAAKAKAVDAFNGDPLNPELLQFASSQE